MSENSRSNSTSVVVNPVYYGSVNIPRLPVPVSDLLPPGRGLPSREAQVLKDLILLACLSVCPDFGRDLRYGIWTGPTRRCHSVYFQSAQKGVPQL